MFIGLFSRIIRNFECLLPSPNAPHETEKINEHCHDKLRSNLFAFKFITGKCSHHDVLSVSGTLIMMMMDKVIRMFRISLVNVILM